MNTRKVTIYVKSLQAKVESGKKHTARPDTTVPTVLDFRRVSMHYTYWPVRDWGGASTVSTENVLPEDQRNIVQAMYEAAFSQGFEIEVIDVAGRKDSPKELALEFLEQARFPVLVTSSGDRLEGKVSSKQIESFLSKVAKST